MTDDLLQKVVQTSTIGVPDGTGGLTYEQADRFIDYMWDATVLGSLVTTRRMRAVVEEIDVIAVGSRLVRGATEAVDTGENVVPTFSKLSITTKKFRLDWELSSESLEDNIEGDDLEDHLARLMATQLGNDLEDIAINGDTASPEPGIDVIDGWSKLADAGGHIVSHDDVLNRTAFNSALKAMPRKYMARRAGLKFFSGSNAIQDYIFSLQQIESGFVNPESLAASGVNQAVRTEGPAGFITGNAFGLSVQEVPLFDEAKEHTDDPVANPGDYSDVWLTFPENLIWGIKREVTVYRDFKSKKDTIEYTVYVRQGVQVENLDAFVVLKNVAQTS